MARIYLYTGQLQEALHFAPSPAFHPHSLFVQAEVNIAMGRSKEARQALLAIYEWIETLKPIASHNILRYRAELQALLAKI
jgi:hypothetical protein